MGRSIRFIGPGRGIQPVSCDGQLGIPDGQLIADFADHLHGLHCDERTDLQLHGEKCWLVGDRKLSFEHNDRDDPMRTASLEFAPIRREADGGFICGKVVFRPRSRWSAFAGYLRAKRASLDSPP